MSLFSELKRRNVFRVGIAYLAGAWLLIEVAGTLFPMFGFGDTPARITVIILAIGFPLFLVFSWLFETTPEGLKLERDIDRTTPAPLANTRRLDRVIIVLLALALGYFALDKFVLEPRRVAEIVQETAQHARSEALVESYGDRSIAVLPFVNMSSDPEQEYFSDGISEELINLLTKIPELRVIARTSAFYYKDKDVKLSDVAEELNVSHILEGSVRRSDDRMRVTAQLIEARSETHLWSETYDRTISDVFAIQDEIAANVVGQLKLKLLGEQPSSQEVDPEAYALWLQGNHLSRNWDTSALEQAQRLFEKALEIEPGFIDARFGLAELHKGDENYRRTMKEIVTLNPEYANAYVRLAGLAILDFDLQTSAGNMQRALDLAPTSVFVLEGATWLSIILGHLDEALEVYSYLMARDPLNHLAYLYTGTVLLQKGHLQEAIEAYTTAASIRPGPITDSALSQAYLFHGDAQRALDISSGREETIELYPGAFLAVSAMALHTLGRHEESQSVLEDLIVRYGELMPEFVAQVYAWSGDANSCFLWLDKGIESHRISDLYMSPAFRPVFEDPRWAEFLERIGRAPEQLAAIEFKVTLPE